ncbi:class I SAM-dependent methyltransferase [Actinoplanes sp. NPDC049596]|uniref:class I SAM-dependent DNA methyltransferase n=1 Tax=unclassified Actinoplanes TaxID=2626549 RepID=UPI0034439B62
MDDCGLFDQQAAHWDQWAPFYDSDSVGHLDHRPAVDLLAELAGAGPALELGIGTGRVALPLADRGVPISGIDASPEMIDVLHRHRGDRKIDARIADMANFRPPTSSPFPLIYVTSSTFFLLGTAQRQIACLRSVADSLTVDGCFAIEASFPDVITAQGQQVIVRDVDDSHLRLTIQAHDPVGQLVTSQEIRLQSDGTWRMLPSVRRYVSPAELDLMAQLAGLQLRDRYGGWDRSPLTTTSTRHVSIYRRGKVDRFA